MNTAHKCLGFLVALGLLTNPLASHAAEIVPKFKKQAFELDPKKKSFIDFGKLDNKLKNPKNGNTTQKFGEVKFKKKKPKKPAAKFEFGVPVPAANNQGHQVSVEMVSLSLVSSAPIALDPFGVANGRGVVTANLGVGVIDPIAKVKYPNTNDKTKGKFDAKLPKFLRLSAKDPTTGAMKKKKLSDISMSATGVSFSQQSPITVTAPFCLQSGANANLCLAPMSVPVTNNFALLAIGLGAVALVFARRRKASRVLVT
jgi:hypothetical protein